MDELTKKKNKHNHKWTDILKVSIFAIIMIAPFIAVFMTCTMYWNGGIAVNYATDPLQIFYNAIDELNNQPIFNWTQQTAIYTAINNMCTGLEFGTSGNTLSLLLTYWSLNTAIYIVFDIIIFCFTKITHFLND